MSMVFLSLDSLSRVDDGRVGLMFKKAAEEAIRDCEDRAGDKSAREVVLTMRLKPVVDQEGHCDGLTARFSCKAKVPERYIDGIPMAIKAGGKAAFHTEEEAEDRDVA